MASIELSETNIKAGAGQGSFGRGMDLYRSGAIEAASVRGSTLDGECKGGRGSHYRVRAVIDGRKIRSATCACDYYYSGHCKHIVALLLTYLHAPERFEVRSEPSALLADLNRDQLLALTTRLLEREPDLYDFLEADIALVTASGGGKKRASKPGKVNTAAYRRRIRGLMQGGDARGWSEDDLTSSDITGGLREIMEEAVDFLNAGESATALEILTALVEEGADALEYSGGYDEDMFAFLPDLGQPLAEAILSLDPEPKKRKALTELLEPIHEDLSNYGIDGLLPALAAATFGWDELPAEWQDALGEYEYEESGGPNGAPRSIARRYVPKTFAEAKLNVLDRRGRTDEYLALCLRYGIHLPYALKLCELGRISEAVSYGLEHFDFTDEALPLAERLHESGHTAEAIRIGERGLELDGPKEELGRWLGPIEEAQGRIIQGIEAWLSTFRASPSIDLYERLKRLAGGGWKKIRQEVIAILKKRMDRDLLAEVLLREHMWKDAIRLAEEKHSGDSIAARVVEGVTAHEPGWALRTSIMKAEEQIAQRHHTYYGAAVEWWKRARAAYLQMGRGDEWQKYLRDLKEKYRTRTSLQSRLAEL